MTNITADDLAAIYSLIESHDLKISTHWRHSEGGVSIVLLNHYNEGSSL